LSTDRHPTRAQELALTSLIAAAYGVGTIAIAPIGYGPIQARITDALIPISYHKRIGKAGVLGVTLGCIIANLISPYGLPDLVIGTLANLLASSFSYMCSGIGGYKGKVLATLFPALIVAIFVAGVLLSAFYGAPFIATMAAITAGELVSCVAIGLPLLMALERAI
jgi:uncharacterized membrane protein